MTELVDLNVTSPCLHGGNKILKRTGRELNGADRGLSQNGYGAGGPPVQDDKDVHALVISFTLHLTSPPESRCHPEEYVLCYFQSEHIVMSARGNIVISRSIDRACDFTFK